MAVYYILAAPGNQKCYCYFIDFSITRSQSFLMGHVEHSNHINQSDPCASICVRAHISLSFLFLYILLHLFIFADIWILFMTMFHFSGVSHWHEMIRKNPS